MNKTSCFWAAVRILIGLLFAYAGFTKLMDPIENFRGTIAHYEVLPYSMIGIVAHIVPWFEFLGGVLMILGYAPRVTASFIAALCAGFLIIMGSSNVFLEEGNHSCGCFGEGSLIHMTMYQMFAMDTVNLFLCLRLATLHDHAFSLDRFLKKH